MNNSKHIPSEKQKQSYRSFTKQSVMENQFRMSIVAHLTKLIDHYKAESDKWEAEMNLNPRQKMPRENYLQYHWEYRAFQCILTNIEAGNYDSEFYYEKYLKK